MTNKDRTALAKKHPESWIPIDSGDFIAGELVDLAEAWSDVRNNGSYYPLLTIKRHDGGERKVHAFGAVLYSEIVRQRPVVGDTITITYLGTSDKEPRPGQSPAERYRVHVEGRDPTEAASRIYGRLDSQGAPAAPEETPAF